MKTFKILVASVFMVTLVACKTTGSGNTGSDTPKKETAEKKEVVKAPRAENAPKAPRGKRVIDGSDAPAGSKFSQIKIGMPKEQVTDIIGSPTSARSYPTAKAWLPFYFGPDSYRLEYIYKGEGRLTIGGNGRLIGIVVDANENGYR